MPTGEKTMDPGLREHMQEIGRAGARAKKVAAVERRIRELVDAAPPLTDSQRSRLVLLLSGQVAR